MLSSKLFTTALFVCLCICFFGLVVVAFCSVKLKLNMPAISIKVIMWSISGRHDSYKTKNETLCQVCLFFNEHGIHASKSSISVVYLESSYMFAEGLTCFQKSKTLNFLVSGKSKKSFSALIKMSIQNTWVKPFIPTNNWRWLRYLYEFNQQSVISASFTLQKFMSPENPWNPSFPHS